MSLRRLIEGAILGVVDYNERDQRDEIRNQIEELQQANESWWNQIESKRQRGQSSPAAEEAIRSNNKRIKQLQSQL